MISIDKNFYLASWSTSSYVFGLCLFFAISFWMWDVTSFALYQLQLSKSHAFTLTLLCILVMPFCVGLTTCLSDKMPKDKSFRSVLCVLIWVVFAVSMFCTILLTSIVNFFIDGNLFSLLRLFCLSSIMVLYAYLGVNITEKITNSTNFTEQTKQ